MEASQLFFLRLTYTYLPTPTPCSNSSSAPASSFSLHLRLLLRLTSTRTKELRRFDFNIEAAVQPWQSLPLQPSAINTVRNFKTSTDRLHCGSSYMKPNMLYFLGDSNIRGIYKDYILLLKYRKKSKFLF